MKQLLIIAFIITCFTGCVSAQVEALPLKKVVAYVDKYEGVVRLDPSNKVSVQYIVPDGKFEHGKEYVFWLEIVDQGSLRTKRAAVAGFAITTAQAQRDQKKEAASLSHRKIE